MACSLIGSSSSLRAESTLHFNNLSNGFFDRFFSTTSLKDEKPTKDSFSLYEGELSIWSNQANSDIGQVEGNRAHISGEFSFHRKKPGDLERRVKLAALYNDAQTSMFSVEEFYLKHAFGKSSLTFGRHVINWSPVDAGWGFGFINNRRNFDFFEPGQEGLTGISFERRFANGFKLNMFGSYLYVPELNPGLKIDREAGTITSGNPWAKVPASSTTLNGDVIPIKYNVDEPDIGEIVFRPSIGANISFEHSNFKYEAFYLKKPENQITIGAEVVYVNQAEAVFVNASPQVFYQNVFGGNIIYTNGKTQIYASSISTVPDKYPDGNQVVTDYTKLETEKIREDYVALGFSRSDDKLTYAINYIARISAYDRQEDILAQNPRWSQALNLRLNTMITKKLSALFDVKYDSLSFDRLMIIQGDYRFDKHFKFSAGVHMIGSKAGVDSYWNDFVANDAVYGRMTYVF